MARHTGLRLLRILSRNLRLDKALRHSPSRLNLRVLAKLLRLGVSVNLHKLRPLVNRRSRPRLANQPRQRPLGKAPLGKHHNLQLLDSLRRIPLSASHPLARVALDKVHSVRLPVLLVNQNRASDRVLGVMAAHHLVPNLQKLVQHQLLVRPATLDKAATHLRGHQQHLAWAATQLGLGLARLLLARLQHLQEARQRSDNKRGRIT